MTPEVIEAVMTTTGPVGTAVILAALWLRSEIRIRFDQLDARLAVFETRLEVLERVVLMPAPLPSQPPAHAPAE